MAKNPTATLAAFASVTGQVAIMAATDKKYVTPVQLSSGDMQRRIRVRRRVECGMRSGARVTPQSRTAEKHSPSSRLIR